MTEEEEPRWGSRALAPVPGVQGEDAAHAVVRGERGAAPITVLTVEENAREGRSAQDRPRFPRPRACVPTALGVRGGAGEGQKHMAH